MAFKKENFSTLADYGAEGVPTRFALYVTADDLATITAAGYFLDADGNDATGGLLHNGLPIMVRYSLSSGPDNSNLALLKVSDAAAGTAVAVINGTPLVGAVPAQLVGAISNPPTQAEVQDNRNAINALIVYLGG